MKYYIQDVDEIHEIIQAEPIVYIISCYFGKTKPEDDYPKVVEKRNRNHQRPIIAKAASWVEYKGPIVPTKYYKIHVRMNIINAQHCAKLKCIAR